MKKVGVFFYGQICPYDRLRVRALYALKQSPRAWNLHLNSHLQKFGFKKLISDTCVYLKRYEGNHLSIVDDLMIAGSNLTIVNNVKNLFKSPFQIQDLGPITNLLGCRIVQNVNSSTITMDQSFYTKKVCKDFLSRRT